MRKVKKWTKEEKQFLIDNYENMIYPKIAIVLDRTIESVKRKLHYMGLRLSEEERRKRSSEAWHKNYQVSGLKGENNPNWKGGISQDHYHYKKLQVMRYPDRVKARSMVYDAVRSGILDRKPCEVCGCIEVFAHHKDYTKPLDVSWLCKKHHREAHDGKY